VRARGSTGHLRGAIHASEEDGKPMTKAMVLIVVGIVVIALSKYLAKGYVWWQRNFFRSWGEVPTWLPRAGYITIGVLVLLIGIYGIYIESK